jgi:hypothetical protein
MIHFDFIVSDAEAENLFNTISDQIANCQYEVSFGDPNHREWYEGRITYLEALKAKMTNSKVS